MKSTAIWAIALGFLALHLGLAAWVPLVEDEAYYRLWSQVPSLGYYDHPPMVAWGMALGRALFGDSAFGVRFISVLMLLPLTFLSYRICWILTADRRASVMAALFANAMMPLAVLGFVATPDAPSVLFWLAGSWALVELQRSQNGNWWFLVGLFAGLGVQSKFTNLFFGVALVLWLLGSREGRAWLSHWRLWAGGALALLVIAPLIWWNMDNGWIGLERQFGRIDQGPKVVSLFGLGGFLLETLVIVTPPLVLLVLMGLRASAKKSLLIWLIAPLFAFMIYHSLGARVQGNWLLPVYPLLAILAALPLVGNRFRWLGWSAAPFSLGLGALILVLGLWPGRPLIPASPFDETKGWQVFSAELRQVAKENKVTWISTPAYGLGGQLDFYLGREFSVWSLVEPKRYDFKGSFPADLCQQAGLYVVERSISDSQGRLDDFAETTWLPPKTRLSRNAVITLYDLAIVRGVRAGFTGCDGS